ncbi:MAG TPA: CsiV family protein [Gammaproteobacteria bacterium]
MKTLAAVACALTLLLTAAGNAAPAPTAPVEQPNWYNVEVIVFRVLDPDAGSTETWPVDPGMPDWAAAQPLVAPDSIGSAVPYQALSPVSEQLGEQWNRLRHSRNYEPLLHVTWTQPALERETAPSVRIGVPPTAVTAPAAGTAVTPAPSALTGVAAAAALALKPTQVYGSAKLSTTGPYLHFDVDLVLQGPLAKQATPSAATLSSAMPVPAAGTTVTTAPVYQLYRLRKDMRVNGGKTAYFDHPLFGAIVLVTPVRHQ